jgi:hypothetical protein
LRHSEYESSPVAFLTYCWVIVEPPPVPPWSWFHAARAMPVRSKPRLDSKERSSAANTAWRTCSGTWSSRTVTRLTLSGFTVASGVPSANVNVATWEIFTSPFGVSNIR